MEFMIHGISPPGTPAPNAVANIYVTMTGTAEELEKVRDAVDAAVYGGVDGVDLSSASGATIRLIIDRRGAARLRQ